jgi:Tfp pilus assembly protein PilF
VEFLLKPALKPKKNPIEALKTLEEALAMEPYNYKANTMMADIGVQMDIKEIAVLAYETLRDAKPEDTSILFKARSIL